MKVISSIYTALAIYTAICLLCPLANYEQPKPIEPTTEEVAFWCNCGVEMRWDEVIMSGV